jgi:hypothetical protein
MSQVILSNKALALRTWSRKVVAGLAIAALAACGGSGGSSPSAPSMSMRVIEGEVLASGSLNWRTVEVRNDGDIASGPLRWQASLAAGPGELFEPSCAESAGCQLDEAGRLVLTGVAAKSRVLIRQPLRFATGSQGRWPLRFSLSETGQAAPTELTDALDVYATQVSVALEALADGIQEANTKVLRFRARLRNDGPAMAREVKWQVATPLPAPWLDVRCTATAGAICPAALVSPFSGLSLPVGAELSIEFGIRVQIGARNFNKPSTWVEAPGDSKPTDNWASLDDTNSRGFSGIYVGMDEAGLALTVHTALWLQADDPPYEFRLDDARSPVEGFLSLDVFGNAFLSKQPCCGNDDEAWRYPLTQSEGLMLGSVPGPGGTTRRFAAARSFMRDLAALDGKRFWIAQRQVDAQGRGLNTRVWSAQVVQQRLRACTADSPTPIEACPSAQLREWSLAYQGQQLELVDRRGEVLRLVAAGDLGEHFLFGAQAADAQGRRWVWLAMEAPDYEPTYGRSRGPLYPMLAQQDKTWAVGYASFGVLSSDSLPGVCAAELSLLPIAAGLRQGEIRPVLSTASCQAGPIWRLQNDSVEILIGRPEGAFKGQWAFMARGL